MFQQLFYFGMNLEVAQKFYIDIELGLNLGDINLNDGIYPLVKFNTDMRTLVLACFPRSYKRVVQMQNLFQLQKEKC